MQYLDTISKVTMISVRLQSQPFNIMVIQVYAPTTNAEEAEIEQDLLELTPEKHTLFITGEWNAKVGSQRDTWNNRQVWLSSTK